tara:strand:+ start:141 stop:1229 length:1089 start_codon:yes stop_codon:yes gene_type:complete
MAYTTIDDPGKHFNVIGYTGDLQDDRPMPGVGFQPDLVWFKNRNTTNDHELYDSSRGVTKKIKTNNEAAEGDSSTRVKSFDSDGLTISTDPSANGGGNLMLAYNWKANGGTTTSFTESGNNPGGTYQANTTAGFSIVTYTGTGGEGTVSHGLGVAPNLILIKARTEPTGGTHFGSDQGNWIVYHHKTATDPETDCLLLNTTGALVDSTGHMNDTAPTSSVFNINTNVDVNEDADTYLAYCFAEKQGYSKFGNFVGNGNTHGPFIYTGFKPAYLIIKCTSAVKDWLLIDNVLHPTNTASVLRLKANDTNATDNSADNCIDFLSNGFKVRSTSSSFNADGETWVYIAFAENPFVTSNGTPGSAR